MSDIQFTTMSDPAYEAEVLSMMEALYAEDSGDSEVDESHFGLTIKALIAAPARGRIVMFLEGSAIRGYALLIPCWSNEFGGNLVFVDELFVKPDARNRGIARRFFEFVSGTRPFEAVAAVLEASPANIRASRLYESVGFRRRQNWYFTRRFR